MDNLDKNKMLCKSGYNLKSSAIEFILSSKSITVFSAYIKLEELKSLNKKQNISRIIVRWEIEDLYKGVSDLEVFDYCIDNRIALYRNTRLHMKALWDNESTLILGSANITGRGIGEVGDFYNYELSCKTIIDTRDDYNYLNKIINSSEYVDFELYDKILQLVNTVKLTKYDFPKLPTIKKTIDFFLISQLPQTSSPEELFLLHINREELTNFQKNIYSHDMILYDIDENQLDSYFWERLKLNFNNHPFIISFKNAIRNSNLNRLNRQSSMRFGEVRLWFSKNTTTVPTPSPYELTEQISILYEWICHFDKDFSWSRPGGTSQVIKFIK